MDKLFHIILSAIFAFLLFNSSAANAHEKIFFHTPSVREIAIYKKILRSQPAARETMNEYPLDFKKYILVAEVHMDDSKEPELLFANTYYLWCGAVSACLEIYKHVKSKWISVMDRDDLDDVGNQYIEILDQKDFGWHEYLNPFDNQIRIFDKEMKQYDCPNCPERG